MRDYIDLLESYEWILLETAQRLSWLIQNFGPKLEAKYTADVEAHRVPQFIQTEIDAELPGEKDATLGAKVASYIMKRDPSQNKAYARWIVSCYLKGADRLEDVNERLADNLRLFQRAAQAKRITLPPPAAGEKAKDPNNIDSYPSFGVLDQIMLPFTTGEREVSGRQDRVAGRTTKVDTKTAKLWDNDPLLKQCTVLYDGDDYMVLSPNTFAASKHFGENTNWCTTTETMYNMYTNGDHWRRKGSPLYIILDRATSQRWQFHFDPEDPQFKDERDRAIDINKFLDAHPKVFQILGENKFAPLIGMRDAAGDNLALRHFSPEVIAQQPTDVLAKAVSTVKDLKDIPPETANTEKFFDALVKKRKISEQDPEKARKFLEYYTKVLNPDESMLRRMCFNNNWILKLLPERFQTDDLKIYVTSQIETRSAISYFDHDVRQWPDEIEKNIPKPWPKKVQEIYWNLRCRIHNTQPTDVPEEFLTDENLASTLAYHPEDIAKFKKRWSSDLFNTIFTKQLEESSARSIQLLEQIIEQTPEEYVTKEWHKAILKKVQTLTKKDEQFLRDQYIRILTKFDHAHWPHRSPKLSARMAELNPEFHKNPEQFHNQETAWQWIKNNPYSLMQLPPQYINAKTVRAALFGDMASNDFVVYTKIHKVLEPCDPKIVKPEYVAEALKDSKNISNFWEGIPKKYLNRDIINVLVDNGDIPFGSEVYPKDAYTPEHIRARFEKKVKSKAENTQYSRHYQKKMVADLDAFEALWNSLPETAKNEETLLALVPKFSDYIKVYPKHLLTQKVLSEWVKAVPSYDHGARDNFKLFPKSAYTSENLATALEKHLIDNVPKEHKSNDEVLLKMMNDWSAKKNINWSKISEDLFVRHINDEANNAFSNLQFNVPKNSPLFTSEKVAFALLSNLKQSYHDNTREAAKLFGDNPSRTKSWEQRDYDLAAGNVVPLKNIPKKFWNKTVLQRAVETDPVSILEIENPAKYLGSMDKVSPYLSAKLLAHGIAHTPAGWVDEREAKRTTVPKVRGSYVVTPVVPSGFALMVFDEAGACVDTLMIDVKGSTRGGYDRNVELFSGHLDPRFDRQSAHTTIEKLKPYRLLIADALEKNPKLSKILASRGVSHSVASALQELGLYRDNEVLLPVEKIPREKIDGTKLTWVLPESASYYDKKYFMFDGENGPLIGMINLSKNSRGKAFEAASLSKKIPKTELMDLSKGFASFLEKMDVSSGNNPKFKESDIYALGVRGPGGGEWYSLLAEKIGTDDNGITTWHMGNRVTYTNDDGLIATGKMDKTGDFVASEVFNRDALKHVGSNVKQNVRPPKTEEQKNKDRLLKLASIVHPKKSKEEILASIDKLDPQKLKAVRDAYERKVHRVGYWRDKRDDIIKDD